MSRLVPMTLRVDCELNKASARAWKQIRTICGTQPKLGGLPMPRMPADCILSEAAASNHVNQFFLQPLAHTFNDVARCTRQLQSSTDPLDPSIDTRLLRALAQVRRVTIVHQGYKAPLDTPDHDADNLHSPPLDRIRLGQLVRHDRRFQDLRQAIANDEDTGVAPDISSVAASDGEAIEQAKRRILLPIPDYTVCWVGGRDVPEAKGGIPFFLMQVEDRNDLSFERMRDVLTEFQLFVRREEDQILFKERGIIRLRLLYCHENSLLESEAEQVFVAVSHLCSQMFQARLTYGTLSNSLWTMTMTIDWNHPHEPGQHVSITLMDSKTGEMAPAWTEEDEPVDDADDDGEAVLPDYFQYGLAVGAQQLATGLIHRDIFEEALHKIAAKHALYAELVCTGMLIPDSEEDASTTSSDGDPDTDDEGGAVGRHNAGRDDDEYVDAPRRRKRRRPANPDPSTDAVKRPRTSTPQDTADVNARLLALIDDASLRTEVQRFLALDNSTTVTAFHKHDLIKMLCAAYPYAPMTKTGAIRLNDPAVTPTTRAPHLRATDKAVFTVGCLWNGWLPKDYCTRLAWMDYPDSARAMAKEARMSKDTSAGKIARQL
ncbi:hypothetical protein sr13611 [Sporisorium reilianum SRZ2]|uniref:Uncharacterized protein n=1 Tax=Sporisorium reilianum (strain SRZ2) TaxID=999809 RepID=E6ZVJ1_SPORE|nr:hypothetical protein sr13611 [Sporisorium reilianum SRZ2]